VFGGSRGLEWLGEPLLASLQNPTHKKISIHTYVRDSKKYDNAIIVNCLDFMYGHCLLKLFNVERYKKDVKKKKIIVIIPDCIRWLVPSYVGEIWSVAIPLSKTREYNTYLEKFVQKKLSQYASVSISDTNCHPKGTEIADFTGVPPALSPENKTVTFYWRQDRLWLSDIYIKTLPDASMTKQLLYGIEYFKIITLFRAIKRQLPDYTFRVVGIGKQLKFPSWIVDHRIPNYNQQQEKLMCKIYAKSSLVIGTLGSHLILPAAHAFMTLELAHTLRTECFGQDMIVPSHTSKLDPRIYYFRHRILPSTSSIQSVANEAISMLRDYQYSKLYFQSRPSPKLAR
jgi:hypothetical protein